MTRILRRLAQSLTVLFAVATFWFFALSVAPGDYFSEARINPLTSPKTLQNLREAYGLSKPLYVRYAKWMVSLAHGDLGESIAYNQPVASLLAPRLRNTLLLSATSLALAWALALGLGFWAGATAGGNIDRTLRVVAAILLAVPEIVVAMLLVYWDAKTGWLPTGGMSQSENSGAWDIARHMVLPVAVLTATTFPLLFRHVRVAVRDTLDAPFIRTALAFGIDPLRLVFRYVLPAAANPLFSLVGLSVAVLLSSSLIVEVVFGWPGLGPMFLDALFARDTYLLLAPMLVSSLLLLAGNLLADILLIWNDPRIRAGTD